MPQMVVPRPVLQSSGPPVLRSPVLRSRSPAVPPSPCLFLLLTLLCFPLRAAELYRTKPDWWSLPTIEAEEGKTPERVCEERLHAWFERWQVSTDWEALGPIAASALDSLDSRVGPDPAGSADSSFTARDGSVLKWLPWKSGEENPIERTKLPSFVFYRCQVEMPQAGTRFLAVTARGLELAIWVNGERIYRESSRKHRYSERPETIELALRKGRNAVLIKQFLESRSDRPWEATYIISDVHPARELVRLRSFLLSRVSPDDKEAASRSAYELVLEYLAADDIDNAAYWVEYLFREGTNEGRNREAFRRLWRQLELREEWEKADDVLSPLAESANLPPSTAKELGGALFRARLAAFRIAGAIALADDTDSVFAEAMKRDFQIYRLRAYLLQGDYEAAKKVLDPMVTEHPKWFEDWQFRDLRSRVEALRDPGAKLAVDYDYEPNLRTVKDLLRDGSQRRAAHFIRDVFEKRNMALHETDDPDLFVSALGRYRQAWADPCGEWYKPSVATYVKLMRTQLRLPETVVARKEHQLSLTSPDWSASVPASTVGAQSPETVPSKLPSPGTTIGRLRFSALELEAYEEPLGRRLQPLRMGSAVSRGEWKFVQSSRHLVGIRGSRIKWQRLEPNSRLGLSRDSHQRDVLLFQGCTPAVSGKRLCARLIRDGRFVLHCLDAETGECAWTYAPEELVLCSDPAIYGNSVLLIGRKKDGLTDYYLVLLDLETGTAGDDLYLCSTRDRMPFHGEFASTVKMDEFLRAPLVEQGTAYINMNAGVICAVDVRSNTMKWVRRYRRAPFRGTTEVAQLLVNRRSSSPIAGERTLLCAPLDALSVLLLDKESGALVATHPERRWQACARISGDRAVVFSDEGRLVEVVSLADLAVVQTFQDRVGWHLRKTTKDGALLDHGEDATVLGSDGAFRPAARLPDDVQALALSAQTILGGVVGEDDVELRAWSTGKSRETPPLPDVYPTRETPAFRRVGNHSFLLAENAVSLLDEDLQPRWTYPVWTRPKHVSVTGDFALLVWGTRIRALDLATGRCVSSYPAPGVHLYQLRALTPTEEGLAFAVERGWHHQVLCTWKGGRVVPGPSVTGCDSVAAILGGRDRVLVRRGGKLQAMTLDRAAGTFKAEDISAGGERAYHLHGGKTVCVTKGRGIRILDGNAFHDVQVLKKGGHEWQYRRPDAGDDWISLALYRDYRTVIDVRSGVDVSTVFPLRRTPVVTDRLMLGIGRSDEGKEKYAAVWYDRAGKRVVKKIPLPLSTLGSRDHYNRGCSVEFSFLWDGKAVHFLRSREDSSKSLERLVVLQDVEAQTLEVRRVPGFRRGQSGIASGGVVALCYDGVLKRFTKDEFADYLRPHHVLQGQRPRKLSVAIDGFPDEWDLSKSVKTQRGTLLATLHEGTVRLVFSSHDQELITRLGTRGLDQRLQFSCLPAGLIGIDPGPALEKGYVGPLLGQDVPGWHVDWQVAPTGDSFFFELAFPWDKIMPYDVGTGLRICSRDALGDLALRIVLVEDGREFPVLGDAAEGGYVRVTF